MQTQRNISFKATESQMQYNMHDIVNYDSL